MEGKNQENAHASIVICKSLLIPGSCPLIGLAYRCDKRRLDGLEKVLKNKLKPR